KSPAASRKLLDPHLLRKLVEIVGRIEMERLGGKPSKTRRSPSSKTTPNGGTAPPPASPDAAFTSVFAELPADAPGVLWGISLNRKAYTSIWRSRLTVKADAASRVFEANTSGIRWAVLDTGIDARHP